MEEIASLELIKDEKTVAWSLGSGFKLTFTWLCDQLLGLPEPKPIYIPRKSDYHHLTHGLSQDEMKLSVKYST